MCCQKYRTLTCPAQQSPSPLSLSGYSFLPGAIEALKNAKNYISKQAKWKETLTKQLCCVAAADPDRSRCMSYEIIISHIHLYKHTMYVCTQDGQHRTCSIFLYVLRLPSDAALSQRANLKTKYAIKGGAEREKNFEILLEHCRKKIT